jgi:hypothetical protein
MPVGQASNQMAESLAAIAGRIGNARIEAITFAVAGDIGPRSGFLVAIARGQYDRRALAREFAQFGGVARQQDGVDVIDMREVRLVLASDQRLIFIVQPPGQKTSVADEVVAAVKTGKGSFASDAKLNALVKTVDRTKPAWAVAQLTPAYQKIPALAGFESATLVIDRKDKGLAASLTAKGTNAAAAVKSAAQFFTEMAKAVQNGERAAAQLPAFKPILASMKTLDYKLTGDKITLTASAKSIDDAFVLPLTVSPFWFYMSRGAPGGVGVAMPMPVMMPGFMPIGP